MPKAYVRRTADVAELVISAPPLNLFDAQLAADLESALDEVATFTRDGTARAVLLRADGRVFCAGVDVHQPDRPTAVGKRLLLTARDHGVAAADAITPRETGQIFATRDLPAGLTSLLEQGPRQATFEGR